MNESFKPTHETVSIEKGDSFSHEKEELFQELETLKTKKIDETPDEDFWKCHEKIAAFGKALLQEMTRERLSKVRLWHMLIGSTVSPEEVPEFDLPGGRIERFIREEL